MTLDLLPKPKRFFLFGKWIFIKDCRCYTGCTGHILILTPFYESGEKIDIYPIDIYQWNKAIEQELNAYEKRMNPSTEEGILTEVDEPPLVDTYQDQLAEGDLAEDNNPSPKVKNKYTPKPNPEQKTGGSSGKGFGPRH
jgi:hypothetical protein